MRTIQENGRVNKIERILDPHLNLKITNWGKTHILKLNNVVFFLNAKIHHILIQLHRIFACKTLSTA